jgi:hypothetical protein
MPDKVIESSHVVFTGTTGRQESLRQTMRDMGDGTYAEVVVAAPPGGEALELLDDAAATGAAVAWPGGRGVVFVNGTWDGADASLEWSDDEVTWWVLGAGYSLSADGLIQFELPAGSIRIAIANAGTTELSATAKRV